MKKIIGLAVICGAWASALYAAPVDIPSTLKSVSDEDSYSQPKVREEESERLNFDADRKTTRRVQTETRMTDEAERRNFFGAGEDSAAWGFQLEGDMVQERNLEGGGDDNQIEGEFYTAKVILPVYLLGQWDWYGGFGWAKDLEIRNEFGADAVEYKLDDDYLWTAGANYIIWKSPEPTGVSLFADAKYRSTMDIDEYDEFSVNGTNAAFTANDDARWQEYQGALGAVLQLSYFSLYGGGKYSQVDVDADVSSGGTRYELEEGQSEDNWGAFGGLSLLAGNNFSVDLEGRFIDETAYSAKANLKF